MANAFKRQETQNKRSPYRHKTQKAEEPFWPQVRPGDLVNSANIHPAEVGR